MSPTNAIELILDKGHAYVLLVEHFKYWWNLTLLYILPYIHLLKPLKQTRTTLAIESNAGQIET